MKIENFLKLSAIIFCITVGHIASAADTTLDYLRNQAFENKLYNKPEAREVTLFDKKDKKDKKKSKKVEVEHLNAAETPEEINITDKEFIEKYKKAANKKIRKKQIDITIQKNKETEEELAETKNKLAGDADTQEDENSVSAEPSDKKFFKKFFAKKNKKKMRNLP